MKRIFNRIFNILLISIVIIGTLTFILSTYFADDIENAVLEKIQANITVPLQVENVEFTIYDNFPSASVKFSNLLVSENLDFGEDTLLYAKTAYIDISLSEVLVNNFSITKIIISNGNLNITFNEENKPNYLIEKANSNKESKVKIEEIVLLNSEILVENLSTKFNMNLETGRAIIELNQSNIQLQTSAFSKNLIIGKVDYLDNKNINIKANLIVKKDTIEIQKSELVIEEISANAKGVILNNKNLDLEIKLENQIISELIPNFPENIKNVCKPFIINGNITSEISLHGEISKESNPLFEMDYTITDGVYELKSIPFRLKNISMNGSVTNGEQRNFKSTKIIASEFISETEKGYLNGGFTLTNLNNYFLNASLKSSWDFEEINRYFEYSPFKNLQGKFTGNTKYNGNIAFDKRFKKMFIASTHNSTLKFENVKFSYKDFPLLFSINYTDCNFHNNKILFSTFGATIAESDLVFDGETSNLIGYIIGEKNEFDLNGDIKSTYTNLKELITISDISEGKSATIFPNWITVNLNTEIKNLSYENFTSTNFEGKIQLGNGTLKGFKLTTNSLDGNIDGNFILTEPKKNHLMLLSDINFSKINIRNSFHAFNNYGQTFIKENEIKGIGTAEMNIEAHWKPNFILDEEKLKIKSHLVIEKGELIDFKTLESLSNYVSVEDLKHVKFSTLENNIEVEDKIITIPNMEIKSSALSVFISGTHAFNQDIDYDLKLLLSELLSTSFRKKNTEFGEEKKDGKIFNTVYLKMTGNTEDPKIYLDKIRFMEDVSEGIKVEKETIINIIKEDVLQTKKKEKDEDGQEVEIEWNPEL
ncbi:hypothetical protein N9D80_00760 [Flavobacteriales bacterium]|nr:hypothetical protein [Flavobacteriales bacterium]